MRHPKSLEDLKTRLLSDNDDGIVIMMIGGSGSGKSTTARFLANGQDGVVVLSSDSTRELLTGDPNNMEITPKVFGMIHSILRTRCEHGQQTVFDATCLKARDRKEVMLQARTKRPNFRVVGILHSTPEDECKVRQTQRDRQVPEWVVEKHAHQYVHAEENAQLEPFDELYCYDTLEGTIKELPMPERPELPSLDISNTLTAFDRETVGSKVTKPMKFISVLREKIAATDFDEQRVPGQAYIPLPEGIHYVSCGVGVGTDDPDDYVIRKHRDNVSMYLKREHAAPAKDLAVVVYTKEAYLDDPDVQDDEDELARATASNADYFLVAVLASAGGESPYTPGRFVRNLAGGNNEALEWSGNEIREKAEEIVAYYDDEGWMTVAD